MLQDNRRLLGLGGDRARLRSSCSAGRHGAGGLRDRRGRRGVRRGVLQHRHDGLPGDPDGSLLCRADHHVHVPAYRQRRHERGGHRERQCRLVVRRARRRAGGGDHGSVELARLAPPRRLAQGPRHRRSDRRRYPGAHGADPRQGHAERGDRPRSGWVLRHRDPPGARGRPPVDGRARPRADGDERPALRLGGDDVGARPGLREAGTVRSITSSPSTTA